jgi:formylglycine-generating enzyme required for sulfatase activity/serine/threonine protein kinase
MAVVSLEQFSKQLTDSALLTTEDVSSILTSLPSDQQPQDGEQFARELVRQKKLTKFQAEQIYLGKGKSLVMGNYTILDKLGQGGMGMVLKAEHKRLKRLVAIKVMSPAALKTPDALKRFHREVEAAAKLRHTNVVATDDADEAKGTHFLVMEYVEGSDLSALVKKKGPMSVEQALQCIIQAARGLEFAHQQGVVHRDIKPANLLLDSKGTVKILDMGLARIEGDSAGRAELTSTGAVMGTVDYMAPEQALSTKTADARSDIYSLGISLWYLLTGRCAYDGDTLMAKLLAHRDAPIPSLCELRVEVPASVDAVFQKMVAKQAKDRYQSMTEVIRDLVACQSGPTSTSNVAAAHLAEDTNLKSFLSNLGSPSAPVMTTRQVQPTATRRIQPTATYVSADAVAEATMLTGDLTQSTDPQLMTSVRSKVGQKKRASAKSVTAPPWWRDWRVQIGGGAAAALLLLGVIFLFQTPNGTLRVEILDPEVEMKVKGSELTFHGSNLEPVSVKPGEKKLLVTRGDQSFETELFTIKKGPETRVKAELLGDNLVVNVDGKVIAKQPIKRKGFTTSTTGGDSKSPTSNTAASAPPKPLLPKAAGDLPSGFVPLFNGKDLTGWKGEVGDPKKRAQMTPAELASAQAKADETMRAHWRVENGVLTFDGKGDNLCTARDYTDFELYLEWKITAGGDSGVYLRGTPQVQIWDSAAKQNGNNMGSGGLYNNRKNLARPLVNADKPIGEWNAMLIRIVGDKVTVSLNGQLVVDNVVFENYFEPDKPIYLSGPIELQKFGAPLQFRSVLIRELNANTDRTAVGLPPTRFETDRRIPAKDYGLRFAGRNQYTKQKFDSNSRLAKNEPWTIEGWVSVDPAGLTEKGPGYLIFFDQDYNVTAKKFANQALRWSLQASLSNVTASKEEIIPYEPQHLALTYDKSKLRLYVNGILKCERPAQYGESKVYFNAGPSSYSATNDRIGFHGTLAEVRFSSVVRYQESFTPPTKMPLDDATVALYHMDEGQGTLAKDSTSRANHLEVVAATWVKAKPQAAAPPAAKTPFTTAEAKAHQAAWAQHLGTTVEMTNSVGAKMILIPPGEFLMGSSDEHVESALKLGEVEDQGILDRVRYERPQHAVVITKPFWMGATEVTVGEFKKFTAATNYQTDAEKREAAKRVGEVEDPGKPPKRPWSYQYWGVERQDTEPATMISWDDAVAYCEWLGKTENARFRLPTEAEWEYACRAGTTTLCWFGDDPQTLDQCAWYRKNSQYGPRSVGRTLTNPFGLFDVYGNVSEWCQDFHAPWANSRQLSAITSDPTGPTTGTTQVYRGGQFSSGPFSCRSAFRVDTIPKFTGTNVGFRLVREIGHRTTTATIPP